MLDQYREEKEKIESEIREYENHSLDAKNEKARIAQWADRIVQAIDIKELDREIVLKLIDHIEIHETEMVNRKKQFKISIYYKFIGNIGGEEAATA